ncbi:MAG: energy transducer TonB [Acidobacteriota bacterium]
MPKSDIPTFGLLPEPEGRTASFLTSSAINLAILATILIIGMTARRVIQQHYEMTELFAPTTPPPPMKVKPVVVPKTPPPPPPPQIKLEAPKIAVEQPKPPEPKPIQMEAKLAMPVMKQAKPNIVEAPQPKAALTAAMPAQTPHMKTSTAAVHLGETFGAKPNPNAQRPATVAALGNPYGGMKGPAEAPHGVVGSTGIGNGLRAGSNAGVYGHVASAGIPGEASRGGSVYGHVASAGIPAATVAATPMQRQSAAPATTNLEVLSKPPVRYTAEARQMHIQGDVVLHVTFLANGQVVVHGIVHGLGHGLDQEARRVAEQIRFRPATRNGRPVDVTTNITITFQLA